jgi:hypothetical protein
MITFFPSLHPRLSTSRYHLNTMRSSTLLCLVGAIISVSHSFELSKNNAINNHSVQEKRQTIDKISLVLDPSSDTGVAGDGITSDTSLLLTGLGDPDTEVSILDIITLSELGRTSTDATGAYSFTTQNLTLGSYSLVAAESEYIVGNQILSARLDVTPVAPP